MSNVRDKCVASGRVIMIDDDGFPHLGSLYLRYLSGVK